jgi:hypothetical protein
MTYIFMNEFASPGANLWLARIAVLAKASVDPVLISTDVGSNPSECMLELASGNTQIKYALSINRDIDPFEAKLVF